MRAIAFLRRNRLEAAWVVFSAANFAVMTALPRWETIPFHLIWVSLTLLYGLRVFSPRHTSLLLSVVFLATAAAIVRDAFAGTQPWDETAEAPLMSAMFLAMVWHARRRRQALRAAEVQAEQRATMLAHQERFLHDVSHELRTPVTIARGHLEVLRREVRAAGGEVGVALDELVRIERIVDRLLLLATVDQQGIRVRQPVDVEAFLEDLFMRWSEIGPRAWRLGPLAQGTLVADEEALRTALDALLENAVKYTDESAAIELRARVRGAVLVLEVEDEGCGVPAHSVDRIFDRFARADDARSRARGGAGLGLAIVAAVTRAHGGSCTVRTGAGGSVFALELPGYRRARGTTETLVAPAAAAASA